MLRFTLPYSLALSKNRVGFNRYTGRRFTLPEKTKAKADISLLINAHPQRNSITSPALFLIITLHRKRRNQDPQNLVDIVSDAVAEALGVSDKDFTILTRAMDDTKCGTIEVSMTNLVSEWMWELVSIFPMGIVGGDMRQYQTVSVSATGGHTLPFQIHTS
jgi:hypothetical protein